MELKTNERFKNRLKEAFGTDTQSVIGEKLHIGQGTVSKLLNGTQEPTAEMLYSISQVYDVSVDWLMGLSEVRKVSDETITYGDILKTFVKYGELGIAFPFPNNMITTNGSEQEVPQVNAVGISDEILQAILHEWRQSGRMKHDLAEMVLTKRIEEYSDILYMPWDERVQALFHELYNPWDASAEKLRELRKMYEKMIETEQET